VGVALEQGFGHVTLDAVAERAGVSKGGLLYHFPTKSDLVRGLLSHYAAAHQEPGGEAGTSLAVSIMIASALEPRVLEEVSAILAPGSTLDGMSRKEKTTLLLTSMANRLARGFARV
jgi:AcrR family transcriptional regulator